MKKANPIRYCGSAMLEEPGLGEAKASAGPLFKSDPWDQEIAELEQFFKTIKLPTDPIRLDKCSTITDMSLFIESHLNICKAQNGNKRYIPYMDGLNEVKILLSRN